MKILQKILIFLLFIIYIIVIPLFFHHSSYLLSIITIISIMSIVALGVKVNFSIGLVNIGQASYMLIGSYVTAILSTRMGFSFWLSLPISAIIASLIGIILGSAILRLKGIYFSMVTLLFAEVTRLAFLNGGNFTGGPSGIWNIPRPNAIRIFRHTLINNFTVTSYLSYYFLAAFFLLFTITFIWRIDKSILGSILRTIRQSSDLALSMGINVEKYRIIAYAICCFLGGLSGSIMVSYMTNVNPGAFTFWDSMNPILYCMVGGVDHWLGPVIGAFLLGGSFEFLRELKQFQGLIYASLMVITIMWFPNGILAINYKFLKSRFKNKNQMIYMLTM